MFNKEVRLLAPPVLICSRRAPGLMQEADRPELIITGACAAVNKNVTGFLS